MYQKQNAHLGWFLQGFTLFDYSYPNLNSIHHSGHRRASPGAQKAKAVRVFLAYQHLKLFVYVFEDTLSVSSEFLYGVCRKIDQFFSLVHEEPFNIFL